MPPRSWGWWTEQKLDILGDYLAAFNKASTTAHASVYLDLFAGQAQNVSRSRTEHLIRGSARRALETTPSFTVLRFFEMAGRAAELKAALEAEYPDSRDRFKVVPGDCNLTIAAALGELTDLNWAPTFAFLDQQSTEVQWPTLQHLARHRRSKWKTELWLLCASGLLPRGLRLRTEAIDTATADRMSAMFGTEAWTEALEATRGELSAADFRSELTNLMRWRLEQDLGYKTTLVFKVTNTRGSEIFDMIFATDHWAGEKIMTDVYSAAARRQPALRQKAQLQRRQAKEERQGRYGLFDLDELAPFRPDDSLFEVKSDQLSPPHPPYRRPGCR